MHIDADHTIAATVNDLRIAERCLSLDGVCCVDDVFAPAWPGVTSGLFQFLDKYRNLVPVALFPYKLFLSRPERKEFYSRNLLDLFSFALVKKGEEFHQAVIEVYKDAWTDLMEALAGTKIQPNARAEDLSNCIWLPRSLAKSET